jgi:A/G-specific adenine glycosylase
VGGQTLIRDEDERKRVFVERLLRWHAESEHHRKYPWRDTRDPYRILIAELLLQRTNAEAVVPVYMEWVRRWPQPNRLPRRSALVKLVAPLGLPTRVPRMLEILNRLRKEFGGVVPEDPDRLADLLGRGKSYLRNAIAILAYEQPVAAVDRTVARVISRVFLGREPSKGRPHSEKAILQIAKSLVPKDKPRQYHLALLDYAALVCVPRKICMGGVMNGVCRSCTQCSSPQG